MRKIYFICWCLLVLGSLFSQEGLPENLCKYNFRVRHIETGGLGYEYGYTSIDAFLFPLSLSKGFVSVFDLRLHAFNNNEYAANFGLGSRFLSDKSYVLGGYIFYDYRSDFKRRHNFSQVGLSVEFLHSYFDVRANGYIPINRTKVMQRCVFDDYEDGYWMVLRRLNIAMIGFDVEVGRSIISSEAISLYTAVGPYYYAHSCEDTIGGRFRLAIESVKYLTLEGIVTYDHLFGLKIQGQVGLTFSFGCGKHQNFLRNRAHTPVFRNEIIVLDQACSWRTNF